MTDKDVEKIAKHCNGKGDYTIERNRIKKGVTIDVFDKFVKNFEKI